MTYFVDFPCSKVLYAKYYARNSLTCLDTSELYFSREFIELFLERIFGEERLHPYAALQILAGLGCST